MRPGETFQFSHYSIEFWVWHQPRATFHLMEKTCLSNLHYVRSDKHVKHETHGNCAIGNTADHNSLDCVSNYLETQAFLSIAYAVAAVNTTIL